MPSPACRCAAPLTVRFMALHPARREGLREVGLDIIDVLQANEWNRNATADELGINRTTLYKKMKRLGLDDPRLQFA